MVTHTVRPCPWSCLGVERRLWSGVEPRAVTCPGEELRKHREVGCRQGSMQ